MGGGARASARALSTAPAVHVRPARAADLDAIHAIEVRAFSAPWRRESFRDYLCDGPARLLVAEAADGTVVGFAVALIAVDEAEIANLAVAPEWRRRGVARRIVDRVFAAAATAGVRTVFLEVRESNAGAIALYAAAGFTEVARRRAYYRDPVEDALVMRCGIAVP